jgi:hypothetical protein
MGFFKPCATDAKREAGYSQKNDDSYESAQRYQYASGAKLL